MKLNYLSKLSSTLFNQNSNDKDNETRVIENNYNTRNAQTIHALLKTKVSTKDGVKLQRLAIKTDNEGMGDYTISINESYDRTFVVHKKDVNGIGDKSYVITSLENDNYASILLDFFIVYIAILSNNDTVLSKPDKKGYFDMKLMNTVMLHNDHVHSIIWELIKRKNSYIPFQSIKPDAFSSFYQPVNNENVLDPLLHKPIHDRFVKNQLSNLFTVVYDNKNSNDHGETPSLHGTINSRVFKDKILQMSMEYDNLVGNSDNIDIDRIYDQNYDRLRQTEKIWSSSPSSSLSTLTDNKKGYLEGIRSNTMAPHHDNDECNQLFKDWDESNKIHEEEERNVLKSDYIHYFNDLDYSSDSCSIYEFSGEVFTGDEDDDDNDELYI